MLSQLKFIDGIRNWLISKLVVQQ